ncbi:MAG TPA: protein kinase [Gemmatimonadaceae bacterium]|nr:protein kinase [Gemmatimonadaceae bacterium]
MAPTSDLQARLQESLGSSYRIERELTGGGMSRVFLAEETALGRRVVIKLLPHDLAAGVSGERFTREVQLAARLQHPHIVPVHTTGAADGVPFYTMPFVEGDTLRARIAQGRIPLDESLRILRDVARALEYAHQHGIVHRDIKPENIFLAGNSAVVSDFGIAKAITVAKTRGDGGTPAENVTGLTADGIAVGTPAYMAPEQATGAPDMDHRVDIYAFGCVAYEMLSGSPPFGLRHPHELIMAHIARTPASLAAAAPGIPPALAQLVMSCLEKSPDRRPQSASAIVRELDRPQNATESIPGLSAGFAAGNPRWRRTAMIATAAVAVLAAIAWFAARPNAGERAATDTNQGSTTLAVLPFVNVGGDTATEYFADGMTDELATALGRIPGLRLAARSSAYRYKGRRDIDVRDVGEQLNVGLVLTGTARRTAQQVRISAQVASVADGVEIWSQTFNRPADDMLSLTDSVVAEITRVLSDRLGASAGSAAATQRRIAGSSTNPAAFDAYLRGKYSLNRRRAGLENAADAFAAAIEQDPQFARAYAGLGSALALLAYFGDVQPPDRVERSREAARTALRLDSTNAEAYVALGILGLSQHQWREAQEMLDRAIALEPNLADAHFHMGRAWIYQGRLAEGVKEIEVARSLEPFSPVYTVWLGLTLDWLGRREQSLAEARRAWELDSSSVLVQNLGSVAFLQMGETDAARRAASMPIHANFQRGTLGYVLSRTGRADAARRELQMLQARDGRMWFDQINIAQLNIGLGDTSAALVAMERAVERGAPLGAFLPLSAPMYDDVRASPRFAAIVRRLGLDPTVLAAPRGGRAR